MPVSSATSKGEGNHAKFNSIQRLWYAIFVVVICLSTFIDVLIGLIATYWDIKITPFFKAMFPLSVENQLKVDG